MILKLKQFAVLSLLFIYLSAPAYPATPIYMWKDSNGVTNFGDDPANAPAGAKVTVWSENSNIQAAPTLSQSEPSPAAPPSIPTRPAETYPEEEPAMPAGEPPDVIYSTYPILAAPPLITFITPLPAFYPYYTWYPVAGGFWCNDFFYPGYYVLNANQFFYNHYGSYNNRRFIGPSPRTIGGQIHGRIINGQFQNLPNTRVIRSGVTSLPATHNINILNPPSNPSRSVLSSRGSYSRSIQPTKSYFSYPSTMKPVSRLQPNSFRAFQFHQARSFRPSYPASSVYHRYAFSAPRSFSAPAGHGFISGSAGQSFGRSFNGFRRR